MKKILISMLILIAFVGCGEKPSEAENNETKEEVKAVKTQKIEKRKVNESIKIGGNIDSYREVIHTTDTGGTIEEIHTINGRWVEEGTKLITLTNKQVESSYMQARAAYLNAEAAYERAKKFSEDQLKSRLAQAKAAKVSAEMNLKKAVDGAKKEEIEQAEYRLESAEKNYEVTKKNYEKNQRLYEKELISESNFLNIENAYKNAESNYKTAQKSLEIIKMGADDEDISILQSQFENATESYNLAKRQVEEEAWKYDIQAAESGYLQAKANYELTKDSYDDLTIEAEISGIVVNLDLEEKNGVKKESVLFTIINNDDMLMRVGIPEKNIEGIQKYNEATIYVEAVDTTYKGTVYEINPVADPRTKKFNAKIKIQNRGHKIKKGMYGNAEIRSGQKEVLAVEKRAIVVEGVESYIYIVEGDRAKKVEVELGTEDQTYTEVISDEIDVSDRVVVEGQFILEDNDKVSEVK